MFAIDLKGKHALVMGVANHRSLSWAIAQHLHKAGAELCLTYASERFKGMVEECAKETPGALLLECDVTNDASIDAVSAELASRWGSLEMFVHGVAFARKEDLEGTFVSTSREGFQVALEVSAYSFLNVTNRVLPLLEKNGASLVTLSYLAADRAVPSYNVMGSAKAVLEQITRQMALELGPRNIRVNAISAGPVSTLAARGVHGFVGMLKSHAEKAPLKRNITKDEVGGAGLFLLSDLASGITGETLMVDAGYSVVA
ncbi:MAG: enoyl-ACP reductase [Candidatus Eisenbacteria bacterium]|uniref:Enoyl-[acyl-carrier-protein] reductase [NADH] n=1 Tax=Eiseniibacteriota bacterium TaxID=2212470 RepID=A0A849SVI0_UNCEI|nr:enoyl-ACP reductase [Candidatus Eisenbacteria bacterium]